MRTTLSLPFALALSLLASISAHAQTLIGSEYGGGDIYEIDGATGDPSRIGGGTTSNLPGLAYNPNTDTLYGTDEDNLYIVDPANGTTSLIGAHGPQPVTGLTFNGANTVLYAIGYNGTFYEINPATGAQTAIGALGVSPNTIVDLATNSAGTVYAIGTDGVLYTVNTATGAATVVGATTGTSSGMTAIAFDDDDTLYGIDTGTDRLMTLDTGTLVATAVGTASIGNDIRGLAVLTSGSSPVGPAAIPTLGLPGLITLGLILAVAGLVTVRRQRSV